MKLFNKNRFLYFITTTFILLLIFVPVYIYKTNSVVVKTEKEQPPKEFPLNYTKEGIQQVVEANNKFGIDLYLELATEKADKNHFISPFSISMAMAMLYEMAKGKTAEEIQKACSFPDIDVIRPNISYIYRMFDTQFKKENTTNKFDEKNYEILLANALWINKTFPVKENYKNIIKQYYFGLVENLDFSGNPSKSAQTINNFVEEKTQGTIKDLILPNEIDDFTVMVLTNSIYFKGVWLYEFDKQNTRDREFKINANKTINVPFMNFINPEQEFLYIDTPELEILELPYKERKISMLIILPKQGNLEEQEEKILREFPELKQKMQPRSVYLISIPKFEIETNYLLDNAFMRLGITSAYSAGADFSNATDMGIFLDESKHKAYIKVDEKGTVASAATVLLLKLGEDIDSPKKINFIADHPFIFIIQDNQTNAILFLGRIVNPVSNSV